MSDNKKMTMYVRRSVQALFFILLPALFIETFLSMKAIVLFVFHGQGTFNSIVINIVILVVISAVTMLVGRFFCGWMCAFGTMGDLIYKLSHYKNKNPKKFLLKQDSFLKWIKYVLLAFIVIFIWGFQIITLPSGLNPWDLFGMLVSFGNWPSLSDLVSGWIPAAVILLAIVIASVFVERFFCRYLCPLGAYFGILSRFRQIFIVKKKNNCGACTLCTKKCSMGIDLNKVDAVHDMECINCMECTTACPKNNAHLEMSEKAVHAVIAGTISCSVITGAYYLGTYFDSKLTGGAFTVEASETTVQGDAANIADGTYTGSGAGFRGTTTVSVDVSSGIITGISIDSTSDDSQYINRASGTIISEIIAAQTSKVDTVTGATFSSKGIIAAVADALSNATSKDSGTTNSTADNITDNTTEGTTTDSTDKAATESTKDQTTANEATTEEEPATTQESTTQAKATGDFADIKDGTYTGSGTGFRGSTSVSVTVKGGQVTDIQIESYKDDEQFFSRAESTVISEIIDQQTTNVDAVSGATYSSNGIKEAVSNALNVTYVASPVSGGHGRH